jgi:hypothetical protein
MSTWGAHKGGSGTNVRKEQQAAKGRKEAGKKAGRGKRSA